MNESLIRKFCESSHRKLIVVIATIAIGLVVLIPLVDEYFDIKESCRALADKLDCAHQTAKTLPDIEGQVLRLTGELRELEKRAVSEKGVSQYRRKLVELIRSADCRVRRLEVSQPTLRPWLENDDPLQQIVPKGMAVKKTPFTLERRSVLLLVDGTMGNVRSLLEQLHKDKALAYPSRLDLRTNAGRGGSVTLEMEMWLFALGRQTAT
ncbi:MAG: hypothetical protein GXP26_15360 [Planctomycetes bacterium]|nr:hypothetical protein [Planctomycetota bacterium]